ncbi:hypothetical protein Pedsa_3412 [Pseudopedobacter saltans DSM 12145]|uniref:Heme oxygenase n=1 Tax=Pseudopedobacter saltans (strain ATCC 51119 / DSM 12145 / JCM 21818 / CCUG 39354 / LMG 10337 / NBRC 100064 / NCIMB 13643) TaxID=762903 RepID=F0SDG3_PSESL|nr:DUF3050 domain-containing protein [Pseudopedobacter saltans]ADY53946.1 hypothetical protein Pedsa_3412 [Pseudopedobacter saltans DSM 12145]
MRKIEEINAAIAIERGILLNHPLYHKINNVYGLQKFMEGHVYAVWDFMSLLKALQQRLTCITVPWFASPFPTTRYLINEIVLAEESDEYIDGRRLSHFEMYLDAMESLEADTTMLQSFLLQVRVSDNILHTIDKSDLPLKIKEFLSFTFHVIINGKTHEIAAAFTFGREDLIPDMFTSILTEIQTNFPHSNLEKLIYYFERHIELDADEHGPLAMKMILELCEDDDEKWQEVIAISKTALEKRKLLWDAIEESL